MKKILIPGVSDFIRHHPSRRIMNTRGKPMD